MQEVAARNVVLVQVDGGGRLPQIWCCFLLDIWHTFASNELVSVQRRTLWLSISVSGLSSLIESSVTLLPSLLAKRGLIRR